MSDTITLKISKRKLYVAVGVGIIILACLVGVTLLYRYLTSPKLTILSFQVVNKPELSYYNNATDWAFSYELKYKFANEGGGTAESVKVVGAFYDSRGLVVNYTRNYGDVSSGREITDSILIIVNSYMHFVPPAEFKISLFQGNMIVDEATLPYG